jgi:hypothetical protein
MELPFAGIAAVIEKEQRVLAQTFGFEPAELEQNRAGVLSTRQLAKVKAYRGSYLVGGAIGLGTNALIVGVAAFALPDKDRADLAPFLPYFALAGILLTVILVWASARARPDPRRGVRVVSGPTRLVVRSSDAMDAREMYVGNVMFAVSEAEHDAVAPVLARGPRCTAFFLEASPVPLLLSMKLD